MTAVVGEKGGEEAYDDQFAPKDGFEERGDGAGGLPVVLWQAKVRRHGQYHEQHGDGETDGADEGVGRLRDGNAVAVVRAELRAPVPQAADVDLLDALHRTRAD